MSTRLDSPSLNSLQSSEINGDENQFLTFQLGEELYGVEILRVQEIKGYSSVMKIPNMPVHIKGVLNLRGTIIPIVELRTMFGMPLVEYNMFTVIIVVVVKNRVMGLVVDSVSDVLNISKRDLQVLPPFGSKVEVSFLKAIGRSGNKLVAILDMDRLLSEDGLHDACVGLQHNNEA